MKPILKKIALILTKTFDTILSLFLVLGFSKILITRRHELKIKKCIVLGNGPSLSGDLDNILRIRASFEILCVNDFPYDGVFEHLKPELYCCIDPFYWHLDLSKELSENDGIKLLNMIAVKAKWQLTLLLPFEMKKIIRLSKLSDNEFVKVVHFNRTSLKGFSQILYLLYKYQLGMPHAQNVLNAALFLAINIGFKEIYIDGADHSWHEEIEVGSDNVVYARQLHFNDDRNSVILTPILKNSFDKNGNFEPFRIDELFSAWSKCFNTYQILNEYARYRKCSVYNLSKKSYIDAFPRLDITTLI